VISDLDQERDQDDVDERRDDERRAVVSGDNRCCRVSEGKISHEPAFQQAFCQCRPHQLRLFAQPPDLGVGKFSRREVIVDRKRMS
jgi:hypothetical protein